MVILFSCEDVALNHSEEPGYHSVHGEARSRRWSPQDLLKPYLFHRHLNQIKYHMHHLRKQTLAGSVCPLAFYWQGNTFKNSLQCATSGECGLKPGPSVCLASLPELRYTPCRGCEQFGNGKMVFNTQHWKSIQSHACQRSYLFCIAWLHCSPSSDPPKAMLFCRHCCQCPAAPPNTTWPFQLLPKSNAWVTESKGRALALLTAEMSEQCVFG